MMKSSSFAKTSAVAAMLVATAFSVTGCTPGGSTRCSSYLDEMNDLLREKVIEQYLDEEGISDPDSDTVEETKALVFEYCSAIGKPDGPITCIDGNMMDGYTVTIE